MGRAKRLPPAVVYAFMALVIILLVMNLAGLLDTFWLALASSTFFGTVGVLRVAGVVERPPKHPGCATTSSTCSSGPALWSASPYVS